MAIEIIPKRKIEEARWPIIVFYLSLILFCFAVLIYFILNRFLGDFSIILKDLQREVEIKRESPALEFKKDILTYQEKIEGFGILLEEQNFNSNFFRFFEGLIHPMVWFREFNLDSKIKEVRLLGLAENFITIGEQIYILKKEPMIREVRVFESFLEEEGVFFKLEILVDPQVFQFREEFIQPIEQPVEILAEQLEEPLFPLFRFFEKFIQPEKPVEELIEE